jgi:hypothetical protein
MKQELARIKRENIRPPELSAIQMRIQFLASDSSLTQITDLINKYAEMMHAVTALRSVCRNTEKRIVQEGKIRACLLREVENIGSSLLGSEFASDPIPLPTPLPAGSREEIAILARQLQTIRNELSQNIEGDPSVYLTAFQDFLTTLETDATLQTLGTDSLRIQTRKLQKKLDKQSAKNQSIAQSISELRLRLQNFQVPDHPQLNVGTKIEKLDRSTLKLRGQLDASRDKTRQLDYEIDQLNQLPRPQVTDHPEPLEDQSSSASSDSSAVLVDEMERSLLAQRSLLQLEVGGLDEQYAAMKRDARHNEAAMKKQLRTLMLQLQVARRDVSPVEDDPIASLFEQIDDSLRGLIDVSQSP